VTNAWRTCRKLGKNIGVEVQACRRCGDGAGSARIDGLIAFAIAAFRRARDVGRQRHFAVSLEERHHVARKLQMEQIALSFEHVRALAAGKTHDGALLQTLARPQMNERGPRGQRALEQNLDAPAALLTAEYPRRDHARIVENQEILGCKQGRQIAKLKVAPGSRGPVQHQHAAGGAHRRGTLGNEFLGEFEVKIRAQHVV
jgi:hypothetical protein